jgi:hypothetical protein
MKANATKNVPLSDVFRDNGAKTCINKGTNGRWRNTLSTIIEGGIILSRTLNNQKILVQQLIQYRNYIKFFKKITKPNLILNGKVHP